LSVDLHINNRHTTVAPGGSLFEYATAMGIRVPTSCVKQGKCKECLMEVTEGMDCLSPPMPEEAHLRDNFRLSCRSRVAAADGVIRCHTMHRGTMRIETKALHLPGRHEDFEVGPAVTRDGDRILLDGEEIDRRTGPIHGVAMDLGTTTVVLRLLDLETGAIIADASFENPQRFGGSDVMARIQYDTEHKGKLLQRTLAGYVTHAIEDFPVDPLSIYEVVVAGNSTMRDLFFRQSVYTIGQDPYQSVTEIQMAAGEREDTTLTATPRKIGLPINPKGRVYGLPIVSGHVGADAAACMLAIDLAHEDRLVALMDIGTNTELIVGNRDRILAASCPAGPAFEGGRIACGMPGLPGAIEKVAFGTDGGIALEVIGGGEPEGICGSGLVDLMSELLRAEWMNRLGRFELEDDAHEITLYDRNGRTITFRESDVNELAQAKGANVAGLHIVMKEYGISFEDLDAFYLAGGFGRHLRVASSTRIGLIPNIDDAKIHQVGNSAIEGACIALLSRAKRAALERLIKNVIHCRLEKDPDFFDYFVEGCQFYPVEPMNKQAA
jgi:uncharacterized 2Fe-2S/4Fe-4S cluster protein (DUF4445 family)